MSFDVNSIYLGNWDRCSRGLNSLPCLCWLNRLEDEED